MVIIYPRFYSNRIQDFSQTPGVGTPSKTGAVTSGIGQF